MFKWILEFGAGEGILRDVEREGGGLEKGKQSEPLSRTLKREKENKEKQSDLLSRALESVMNPSLSGVINNYNNILKISLVIRDFIHFLLVCGFLQYLLLD